MGGGHLYWGLPEGGRICGRPGPAQARPNQDLKIRLRRIDRCRWHQSSLNVRCGEINPAQVGRHALRAHLPDLPIAPLMQKLARAGPPGVHNGRARVSPPHLADTHDFAPHNNVSHKPRQMRFATSTTAMVEARQSHNGGSCGDKQRTRANRWRRRRPEDRNGNMASGAGGAQPERKRRRSDKKAAPHRNQ